MEAQVNKMNIIIEGCDKSGKSTIIEALKNKVPGMVSVKLMTKPRTKEEADREYIQDVYKKMRSISRTTNLPVLFDRFYLSEVVYSFKRGYEAMDDPFFKEFDRSLKEDTILVLLEVDPELIAKRFKKDREDFAKEEEIELIQKRYRTVFEQSELPKIKIDPTDRLEEAVEEIMKFYGEQL